MASDVRPATSDVRRSLVAARGAGERRLRSGKGKKKAPRDESRGANLARVTRLELAASGVTGRRSNQLSYTRVVWVTMCDIL